MFPALLTVLLFASSGVAGERASRYWGPQLANLLRLLIAAVILVGVTVGFFSDSLRWGTFWCLFWSGVVGFGFGDISLFQAYVRIGARLTILLNLCTAPIWSAVAEWAWLGTRLTGGQVGAVAMILAGVVMAILSRPKRDSRRVGAAWAGVLFGLGAGMGQGIGAVISRKAFEMADVAGFALNGVSAAAQRICGGFLTVLVVVGIFAVLGRIHFRPPDPSVRPQAWAWLSGTALCGPVLGVSCFQWSLKLLPSGLASAVVAMTPIAMIPMVMVVDGERPRWLSVAGACVAVGGVVWLLMLGV